MKKTNKKGFTLVELLVVIAIIAIIAAVAVPVTITQIDKAKIGAATDEANNVKNALNSILTELTVAEEQNATTAVNPATVATTLKEGLDEAFVTLEQVQSVYFLNDGATGDMIVTIVTSQTSKKAKDEAKGYVSINETAFNGAISAGTEDKNVSIQYKFRGPKAADNAVATKSFLVKVTFNKGNSTWGTAKSDKIDGTDWA